MSDVSRVEEIFLVALEQTEPDQRAKYLDAACAGDVDLRRQVEELLVAQPKLGRFLEPGQRNGSADEQAPTMPLESTAAVGDRAGPYKLLERIGEGGMGEVWVADQQEPIKRRVALKLIKPGMDSRSVLARFEAERQALAVMDHPNIAKVLDAGTTKDGRPYFVMELVKGTPITEFADARQLTPKQRLEMFVPVCQAIQHAHMKGIIHRDIKPSNVLVAMHDEIPIPKVIDFGVAKAVGQQFTEKTIYTGFGALIGTPAYMAPEQATFNQLDIDTRADVYSLGVLLYELLAGSPPIEAERMKKAAIDEVLRIVRDEEPPRPSQRLSTSQMRASIAATRQSDPAKLSQLMKGEIDWIVMKALEKDRTRRYDTANGLAVDVQRYLCGEQVQAVPPSLGYRLAKAYRRNRAAVLLSTAFTLMLLIGVATATILAIQARRAEAVARYKEQEAQEQRAEAEQNKDAWLKVSEVYWLAAIEAEIRSASARLDADLLEVKSDARMGLLRLARPLKDSITIPIIGANLSGTNNMNFKNDPEFVKLREFQTAAVISAGQEFVPLVPHLYGPVKSDNTYCEISPDGRLCISGVERTGLGLLAIPSLNHLGKLRENDERVLQFGFSPDSKTIWTQDIDSVVRFWNTDGALRAKTPLSPERFIYSVGLTHDQARRVAIQDNPLLVAAGVALIRSAAGQYDLYDTQNGRFIRRLTLPGRTLRKLELLPNLRRIVAIEDVCDELGKVRTKSLNATAVILSADDGREVARLAFAGKTSNQCWCTVSPSGKWALTINPEYDGDRWVIHADCQLYRCSDWQPVKDSALQEALGGTKNYGRTIRGYQFVTDDVLDLGTPNAMDEDNGLIRLGQPGSWTPWAKLGNTSLLGEPTAGELGGTLIRCGRVLTDAKTFERLKPPLGRKYAEELAKIAPDGRFFENLDTVTEKELIYEDVSDPLPPFKYVPGFGRITMYFDNRGPCHVLRILPDATRLNIPPELLELWAQVVVGGEITPESTFQPWDQPTWAAKQKELAVAKPPYDDFPFPGWAATEPNLWYRIQANRTTGAEREMLREEWQRRSGRDLPKLEPDTWQTPEIAPLSNEPNSP